MRWLICRSDQTRRVVIRHHSSGLFLPPIVLQYRPHGQHRRGIDIVGIHHVGHPLQRGQNHGLLPLRQALELLDKILLQRVRCPGKKRRAIIRQVGVHLALVLGTAHTVDQVPMLQAVQNRGYRGLAEAHLFGNGANGYLTKIPNGSHDQQLWPGQPGVFAQALGMQVCRPDYTP